MVHWSVKIILVINITKTTVISLVLCLLSLLMDLGRNRWVIYGNRFGWDYEASQIPPEW